MRLDPHVRLEESSIPCIQPNTAGYVAFWRSGSLVGVGQPAPLLGRDQKRPKLASFRPSDREAEQIRHGTLGTTTGSPVANVWQASQCASPKSRKFSTVRYAKQSWATASLVE